MTNELKDVEVVSVGLVKNGAQRKPFFIVKSLEEGDQVAEEEQVVEEVEEVPEEVQVEQSLKDGLWGRFWSFLTGEAAEKAEAPVEEVQVEEVPVDEAPAEDVEKGLAAKIEALEKSAADMKAELAKAQETAEVEKNLRLDREYLEKADAYNAVGVAREELAKALRKADEAGIAEFIDGVLKAADAAMRQSGVYEEKGTSESDEDQPTVIAKTNAKAAELKAENPDLTDAEAFTLAFKMAGADKSEAEAYVAERQRKASRK